MNINGLTINKTPVEQSTHRTFTIPGIGWLAAFWSYSINHSILWAFFHGLIGPAYIAYRIVFHSNVLPH